MKKYSKYFVVAMSALAFAFSTGTLLKVNATPATSAAVPAQPVDLTYAAEKSLPSVVHILSTKNSKVQTVEVESDPFSDFFSDPFGFFGNPQGNGGKQKRSVRTPKQQGSGSGVIISTDGYIVTNNLAFRKDILHCACAPFRMTEQRQLLPLCHFERNEVKSKNPQKGSKAKTFFIAPALHSE